MPAAPVFRGFCCLFAPHNIGVMWAAPLYLSGAARCRSARPDQGIFAIVAFEEVGVDGCAEGGIVELDRVVGPILLGVGLAPGGTDLDAGDDDPQVGRLVAGGGGIAGMRRALASMVRVLMVPV